MTQEEENHLSHLLTTFGATGLGDGDPVAGANLLAAWAVTIANLARPDSRIQTPQHDRMRVGSSLLVSGPLSSSLVIDCVITELGMLQNNLAAHLRDYFQSQAREASRFGSGPEPPGPFPNQAQNTLIGLQKLNPLCPNNSSEENWASVLAEPPNLRHLALAARPKVLVTAARAADLEKSLAALHMAHPLVHLGVTKAADFDALGELCPALMDGRYSAGAGCEIIRGHIFLTDPLLLLCEAAKKAGDNTAWLGRLLWLTDGNAGPEVPKGKSTVGTAAITGCLTHSLRRAMGRRLDNHNPDPVVHEVDLSKARFRWLRFLKSMEPSLPGITGTARSLLTTLVFGLNEIARPAPRERWQAAYGPPGRQTGLVAPLAGVEAFARFLVRRMANAHAAMQVDAEDAWRAQILHRILCKLADGRKDARTLYRHLSIPACLCEELLLELEGKGLVRCAGRKWERLEGAAQALVAGNRPPLEV